MASNNDNTSNTVGNNLPQEQSEKPTEKTPTRESAPAETTEKPHDPPKRSSKSATAAAPPEGKGGEAKSEGKRAEAKPAESKAVVDGKFYLVDLPGYGYARVPAGFAEQWKVLI